jgi:hypothetical protein
MIPAESGIRPRAVHVSGDRLMSLQAILDASSVAVVGASRPGTVLSMLTAQRRASGNRIGADVWCYWLLTYLTAQYCDVYLRRLGRCIRLR